MQFFNIYHLSIFKVGYTYLCLFYSQSCRISILFIFLKFFSKLGFS